MTLLLFVTLELHRYLRAIPERAVLCRAIGTQAGFSGQLDPTINWPKGQQSRSAISMTSKAYLLLKSRHLQCKEPGIQLRNETI